MSTSADLQKKNRKSLRLPYLLGSRTSPFENTVVRECPCCVLQKSSCILILLLQFAAMFSFFGRTFAETATSENVGLQNVKHVDGVPLKKNGHGIRSINVFGWDINVYVANFYSATLVLSEADAMECHGNSLPMQLDFTFLRTVDQGRVVSAWAQQLEHSVTHRYEGYESDRDVFIDMFSSKIENGGTQTVQLVGEETVLLDQGVHKGSIAGRGFQRAFLSMWFGEKAVAEDLKANLLKGSSHFEDEQPAHPVAS